MCVSEREISELKNHSGKSCEILGEKLVFDENAPGKELLLAGTGKEVDENAPGKELLLAGTEKEVDENAPGKELLLPGTEKGMDENAPEEKEKEEEMMKSKAERVASYLGEKSKGVIAGIENTSGYLVEKLDEVFPPESRERVAHWIEVGAPYITAGVAVASYFGFTGRLFGSGGGGGEKVEKMMKAPGLKGVKIPRKPFEDNPRAYFRATRGKF